MDAFLLTGSSSTARINPSRGDKPPVVQNLLYNPQPCQRFVFPNHNDDKHGSGRKKGPTLGGGGASGYKQYRSSKLLEQAPKEVSQIFTGMSFYFNGRSGDKQTMHLKGAVSKLGGRTTPFMSMKGVTHVIAENLSAVKTDKAMKSLKMKVVHPDWLNQCIAEGKLLSDVPFRVVRSQKLGMGNFFGPSASSSTPVSSCSNDQHGSTQKENKKGEAPRRRRSSSGHSSSRLSISGKDRHEEVRKGSQGRAGGVEGGEGGGGGVAGPTGASATKLSNGHGEHRRQGRDVGVSAGGDSSKTRQSSKKRARTISSRAGCDGVRSQGSTSMHDRIDRKDRESDARIRGEAH